AKTILIAAGTQPKPVLSREDPSSFALDGKYFRASDEDGAPTGVEKAIAKPEQVRVLLARRADGRFISYFGDVHPSFFGNVVKAMGSAKQGFPIVSRVLESRPTRSADDAKRFLASLNDELRATVHRVDRLTPKIVEVIVRAPMAA